jgi:hypothetical protein
MTKDHDELIALLTRRQALTRASTAGLAALTASALPLVRTSAARAATPRTATTQPSFIDGTLQAFADTMVPGRRTATTESGQPVYPGAIAGVDPLPGAVEADALALYGNTDVGFTALEPAFLADLEARSLTQGNQFLGLTFEQRVQVCLQGLDFSNPTYLVWEAASAVPFTAFCAAALVPEATQHDAVGYRVMGLPGTAPHGYQHYSWRKRLSRERTRTGSLP